MAYFVLDLRTLLSLEQGLMILFTLKFIVLYYYEL